MTQSQITSFKRDIREFHKVIDPIAMHFNGPGQVTLTVLVQNLGFEWGNTVKDYNVAEDNMKIDNLLKMIQSIADYAGKQGHFENYVANTIHMIYMGYIMEEEEEMFPV